MPISHSFGSSFNDNELVDFFSKGVVATGAVVSSGVYPNFLRSSSSSRAFLSISSKSMASSVLLILFAANLDFLGPLPFEDKIDFLAVLLFSIVMRQW